MTEQASESKSGLRLDTDWISGVGMLFLLIVGAILASVRFIQILHRSWPLESIHWQTWFCVGVGTVLLITVRERVFKLGLLLLLIGPVCRILLGVFKATPEIRLTSAPFLTVISLLLYAGVTIYVIWWFRSKISHV